MKSCNSEEIIRFLGNSLFNENNLLEKLELCETIYLKKNTILLAEGDYIANIPIIIDGKIKVIRKDESGKEILLYNIYKGESCALTISSCLAGNPSRAYAIAESDSKLLIIPSSNISEWMDKYKSWREFVLQLYYSRFDELIEAFDAIAFRKMDVRLIETLREKRKSTGKDTIAITHLQLAAELGTAREVVSRILKQLERKGMLKNYRGRIKVF